jgi:hypothetical protein
MIQPRFIRPGSGQRSERPPRSWDHRSSGGMRAEMRESAPARKADVCCTRRAENFCFRAASWALQGPGSGLVLPNSAADPCLSLKTSCGRRGKACQNHLFLALPRRGAHKCRNSEPQTTAATRASAQPRGAFRPSLYQLGLSSLESVVPPIDCRRNGDPGSGANRAFFPLGSAGLNWLAWPNRT